MSQDEDVIERTLAMFTEVSAYTIPPRMGSGGVRSGSWRVEDRIFTGRVIVMDCGSECQLRLTDANTGELFAMCPLRVGERMTCVEPASDSSRNFVIRVVDPTSKRHAFLGMGFPERDDAFDFNVALSDWEKHSQGPGPSAAGGSAAAAAPQHDFSLKAGETIKVKPVTSRGGGGGLMSGMAALRPDSSSGGTGLGAPLLSAAATSGSGTAELLPPPAGGFSLPPPPAAGSGAGTSTSNGIASSGPGTQKTAAQQQPSGDTWTAFA